MHSLRTPRPPSSRPRTYLVGVSRYEGILGAGQNPIEHPGLENPNTGGHVGVVASQLLARVRIMFAVSLLEELEVEPSRQVRFPDLIKSAAQQALAGRTELELGLELKLASSRGLRRGDQGQAEQAGERVGCGHSRRRRRRKLICKQKTGEAKSVALSWRLFSNFFSLSGCRAAPIELATWMASHVVGLI